MAIENSSLADTVDRDRYGRDWTRYTRTVFDHLARKINGKVTKRVIDQPYLIRDLLLIGSEELDNILFKNRLGSVDDFIDHLRGLNGHNTHHWISGKTLHHYWHGGNAKDKKLNVLLTFLDVEFGHWDEWKRSISAPVLKPDPQAGGNREELLKNHYLGYYYRYYQKTDGSPVLVKTPFHMLEEANAITALTKTLGHYYRSSSLAIRAGVLYVECENLNWNEKESHVYNVGFETHPQLLIGVSNTLNRRGRALAIKNVLVRQKQPFDYDSTEAVEIPFDTVFHKPCEESRMITFFQNSSDNLITTPLAHNFDELPG